MNIIKSCVVLLSVLLLTACGNNDFNVSAQFNNTQDIEEGDSVYFEGKKVGSVSDVSMGQTGSTVEISLKPNTAKQLTAKLGVVVNRLKKGAPLELYNQVGINGEKLQSGQQIEGLDSMFQLGAWMVGDVIQIGSDSLGKYVGAFQEYLGSKEFEKSKQQVQQQISNVTKSTAKTVKMIEEDMLSTLDDLALSEEQMAQIVEQLGEDLSPIVGEAAKSGSELVNQLEQLVTNLEKSANLTERQSGEKLLQSLVETFEKLNESIEEGAKQGLSNTESAK